MHRSFLTTCSSGTRWTWSESWTSSDVITTSIAFTSRSTAVLRENDLASRHPHMPSLTATLGGPIAVVCSRCRSRRNLRIRHGRVEDGGLLSYGANFPALFRRVADTLDKILRGAK